MTGSELVSCQPSQSFTKVLSITQQNSETIHIFQRDNQDMFTGDGSLQGRNGQGPGMASRQHTPHPLRTNFNRSYDLANFNERYDNLADLA